MSKKPKSSSGGAGVGTSASGKPRCGLCGKRGKLMRTECCGNWICNDHDKYVLFSYARNSCARNHDRFTLCGYHRNEGHGGDWARVAAAMTLGRIAQAHAESRASCLARLVAQLEHYAEQTDP